MASQAGKLAPLLITVAGAGYCVWPYIQAAAPPAAPKSDMPKIEASWLDPSFPSASPRNIFQPVLPKTVVEAEKAVEEAKVQLAKKVQDEPKKEKKKNLIVDGWTLGATMVHGTRRGAVVNGKVYLEGEKIPPLSTGTESLTLFRVERDRVILRRSKRSDELLLVELDYSPTKTAETTQTDVGPRLPGLDAAKSDAMLDQLKTVMGLFGASTPLGQLINRDVYPKEDVGANAAAKPGETTGGNSDEGPRS
jgi:hypothetical protein